MTVKLKNVRLAFPNLFKPTTGADGTGDPAFNAAFLIPKDHPQIGEIKAAMIEVAKAKWGDKAKETYSLLDKQGRVALRDGDTKSNLSGYEGNFFMNARNKTRPTVVDRDRSPLAEGDGKPYSGCYVDVILEFWAQDNKHGKRVNASLGGVQFRADGDAFTGGTSASADDFDDISADAGATADAGEGW